MIGRAIIGALASMLAAAPALAAGQTTPLLARIFGDHAVLQRDRPIVVWGHARPGTTLTISMAGGHVMATGGKDGDWRAQLPAMAAGGPYTLTATADGQTQVLSDVMIGDVYLCSGQSNMEFPARQSTGAWGGLVHKPDPMLRYANIAQDSEATPLADLKNPAPWHVIDEASVGDASAVCYYMARSLQRSLHVPVGFVASDWGGTTIQSWISPTALSTLPTYTAGIRAVALSGSEPVAAARAESAREEAWWRRHDPRWQSTRRWAEPGFDDSGWATVTPAGSWKGGGNADLASFNGVVWLRQTVDLTAEQATAAQRLLLGPIDRADTVWINGRWTGSNGINWFWRDYAVPAGALHAGRNVIAIRALGSGALTGQPDARKIMLAGGGSVPLAAAWRYRLGAPLTDTSPPTSPWAVPASLATLYNGMIAPIAGYGFKLAAWYQGEANVEEATNYRTLLPLLIADWRRQTGQPDLPFLIAQLASYGDPASKPVESGWAMLREAQAATARADPRAGLAVTLDLGDRHDIHPTQKLVVGERLARAARAVAYGETGAAGGPEAIGITRSGTDLIVAFRNAAGLRTYSADAAIGFEACAGATCRFVPASVEGDRIVLHDSNRPGVTKVRYAWADAPYVNLYNGEDLPAVPFERPVD